jgi:hypothetical protein
MTLELEPRDTEASAPDHGNAGFSLVEALVATALAVEVLLIAFLLFDVNARVARTETQVADLQQSQRIAHGELVRYARMAGRGGLPVPWAYDHRDNVVPPVAPLAVVAGTDMLTARGVIDNAIYQVDTNDPTAFSLVTGTLVIKEISSAGFNQPLDELEKIVDDRLPEALIMVSSIDNRIFGVVEIQSNSTITTVNGVEQANIRFATSGGSAFNQAYLKMSSGGVFPNGIFPPAIGTVVYAGVLEEYRFYVRNANDADGGFEPKLSRARFYPNTNVAHPDGGLSIDIAEGILDLQIAEGRDRAPKNGMVDENPADTTLDDWLLNSPGDDEGNAMWIGSDLLYLRVNTLARTENVEPKYLSAPIDGIENRCYGAVAGNGCALEPAIPTTPAEIFERQHHRREMSTIVELRNL